MSVWRRGNGGLYIARGSNAKAVRYGSKSETQNRAGTGFWTGGIGPVPDRIAALVSVGRPPNLLATGNLLRQI